MKSNNNIQQTIINKKLIIHFDVDTVLRINHHNKDLFVYQLCSKWVWGKLQKNSKQDPQKITGWKISVPTLNIQQPQNDLITYHDYLQHHLKPSIQQKEKLLLNLSKGPASKAKAEIQKNIKNITLPKTLYETLKQTKQNQNKSLKGLLQKYSVSGKYEILPAFYKYIMWLKKSKRQFALIIKNNKLNDKHKQIIQELNLFFIGEHPLFNGKNGTPLVKFDGSKGCKNFIIDESHQSVFYLLGQKEYFSSFGTLNVQSEKDVQLFKQYFKSLKLVKLCEGISGIYTHQHAILAESACIYQANNFNTMIIDPVDYFTHQIYFTNCSNSKVYSCLGNQIQNEQNLIVQINIFQYLKDVDYFIKHTENLQKKRAQEIEKFQKGDNIAHLQNQTQKIQGQQDKNQSRQSDSQYLKRTILPVLDGALKQVTLLRPQDPIGYLALLCLKNKDRIKASK